MLDQVSELVERHAATSGTDLRAAWLTVIGLASTQLSTLDARNAGMALAEGAHASSRKKDSNLVHLRNNPK